MNRLRTIEARRKIATGLAVVAGSVGLTGCGLSLDSNGDNLKPETKQALTRILKPKAAKIGRLTYDYAKSHPDDSTISADPETKGGFDVFVDKATSGNDYTSITVGMRKVNGRLDPNTTYEVAIDSSMAIGKERFENSDSITSTEPPIYGREVWYAESYTDIIKNGKSELEAQGLPTSADSHIDYPNDSNDVSVSLEYARDEAKDIMTALRNGITG